MYATIDTQEITYLTCLCICHNQDLHVQHYSEAGAFPLIKESSKLMQRKNGGSLLLAFPDLAAVLVLQGYSRRQSPSLGTSALVAYLPPGPLRQRTGVLLLALYTWTRNTDASGVSRSIAPPCVALLSEGFAV